MLSGLARSARVGLARFCGVTSPILATKAASPSEGLLLHIHFRLRMGALRDCKHIKMLGFCSPLATCSLDSRCSDLNMLIGKLSDTVGVSGET